MQSKQSFQRRCIAFSSGKRELGKNDIFQQQTRRKMEKKIQSSRDSQIHHNHNHLCLEHHKNILKIQKQGLNKFPFREESSCVAAS